jgi:DNA-binding beta-propeller fold protein YncE
MGYAKHVGRVGALAVALGIGAAVATTPGVAWAEGPDDPGVEAPKSPDAGDPGAAGVSTPSTERQDPGEVIRRNIERAADDLRDGIRKVVTGVVRSSGGAITSTHRTGSNSTNGNVPPVIIEENDQPESPQQIKQKSTTFVQNTDTSPLGSFTPPRWHAPQAQVNTGPAPKPIVKAIDDVKDVVQQSINAVTGNQSRTGSTAVDRNAFSTLDSVDTEDQQQVRTGFVTPIAIITNVVNAALAPFLNPTPGQPAPQNPILWAVLGWVRRQVQDTPFGKIVLNRAPVGVEEPELTPVVGTDNIRVSGFATDPDGDDLETVGATNGAHGTVTINDDGSVNYDPVDGYSGVDTFTVTVSDEASGFHLHGLGGLFQPSGGHTTTVDVSVVVVGAVEGDVDEDTGKVTTEKTVDTSKIPHPEDLVGTKYPTQFGEVEITAYDADTKKYTFVFTPDASARLGNFNTAPAPQTVNTFSLMSRSTNTESLAAAAALGPPTYDDVTITVGEAPNQQTFSFRVPITPARLRTDADAITTENGPGPMAVSGDKLYVLNGGGLFGGGPSSLTVVDTTTNTPVGEPIELPGTASDVVARGNRVYVRTSDGIIVVNTDDNTLIDMDSSTPEVDPIAVTPGTISYFPGGMVIQQDKLYAISGSNSITVIDLDTNTVEDTLTVDGAQIIYGETISGDKLFVSDVSGKTVRAISIAPGANYGQQVGPTIQLGDQPSSIIASPPGADNSYVYVATPLSQKIVVIDPTDNHVVGFVPTAGSQFGYTSFAFSPDGTLLYAAGEDSISVIDTSTNQLVLTTVADTTPDPFPTFIAASPDNAHIYFSDTFANYPSPSTPTAVLNNKVGVVSFYVGTDEVAPVVDDFDDPTEGDADPASGAVAVVVHAVDGDGDALSVTVSQQPQHGTVAVTPGTGGTYTVTYTPDGQSRLDAYDGVGDMTDQFVITVNDGQQSVSKVVNVPIDKTQAAVTSSTPIGDGFQFPRGVAFDENGNLIYTVSRPVDLGDLSAGGVISLILANGGDPVDVYNSGAVGPTLTAPEDMAVGNDGVIYVADPTTGTVEKFNGSAPAGSVDVHGNPVGLFTTPSGDVYAIVSSVDDTTFERVISVYDVTNDAPVGVAYSGSESSKDNLIDVAMTSGGSIYVTNPSDGTVSIVGASTTPIDVGGTPTAIAVDPTDGRVFVTVNRLNGSGQTATGTLELVEITDGTAHHVVDLYTSGPGQASLNEGSDMAIQGSRIYVTRLGISEAGAASGSISVVDADSGELLDPIGLGTSPYAQIPTRIVFSPDGTHAYVVSAYGVVSEISFADTADSALTV